MFSRVDGDPCSPPTTRGSRRKHGCRNPYAAMGLDKFSVVLADLEARREKVMAQEGASTSLVRFVYSNSDDWIPIVVKAPPQEQPQTAAEKPGKYSPAGESQKPSSAATAAAAASNRVVRRGFTDRRKVRGHFTEGWRWHPSCYWPLAVALILLCLVFGRSFAICCASIGWYLLPCISGDESALDERTYSTKEESRRRASEKRPPAAGGGEGAVMTPALGKEGRWIGLAPPRRRRKSTHAAAKQRS